MSQLFYTPQNKPYAMPSQTAMRSLQVAIRKRSYRTRGYRAAAAALGRAKSRYRPTRYLAMAPKLFTVTGAPFNLAMISGAGATSGCNWYQNAQVPNSPTGGGAVSQQFAMTFTLAGTNLYRGGALDFVSPISNASEYISLFDSYRIRGIQIEIVYNSNSVGLGASTSLPVVCFATDYDDVAGTNLANLAQYNTFRAIQFGNNSNNGKVKISLKPKVQTTVATYSGALIGLGLDSPWLDCSTAGAEYFGLKGFYDNQQNSGTLVNIGFLTFYVKYLVEFKNPK